MTTSQLQSFATAKNINLIIEADEFKTYFGLSYGLGNKVYWFTSDNADDYLRFNYTYNKNTGSKQRLKDDVYRVNFAVEKFLNK
tara:strand:+ start:321 stop:572 length:252 start_codon:yes stop_codon:yes gene_type:complete